MDYEIIAMIIFAAASIISTIIFVRGQND